MKYPPWFDTCAFLVVLICSLLGFGGLLSPPKTEAAPTKSNLNSSVTCWHATCAQPADPMIGAQFAATLPQEVRSADATCTACPMTKCTASYNVLTDATINFGHCVFSSSTMTTSDGNDPTMAVVLIPTKPAGSTSAAVPMNYYFSTMPVRHDSPAYTSEGASTGRFTGAASMYAEAVPTYRLAPPEYIRMNRLFRQPDRATRASPQVASLPAKLMRAPWVIVDVT